MQILAIYRNWKWLFSIKCFIDWGRDINVFHYSRFLQRIQSGLTLTAPIEGFFPLNQRRLCHLSQMSRNILRALLLVPLLRLLSLNWWLATCPPKVLKGKKKSLSKEKDVWLLLCHQIPMSLPLHQWQISCLFQFLCFLQWCCLVHRVGVSFCLFGSSTEYSSVPSEAAVSSIALASTYVPPSRVFLDEPFNHNDLPSTVLSRSEGTTYPNLVIRPSIDWIALPLNANGLQNLDYAHTLLGATIAYNDSKGTCTSLNDVMMRCYGSHYEVSILIFPILLHWYSQIPFDILFEIGQHLDRGHLISTSKMDPKAWASCGSWNGGKD